MSNIKLYTYDPTKKKMVLAGDLVENVFSREVKPEHFMKVVDGYGIQEEAFQQLIAKGVQTVEMHTAHGTVYTSPIQNWIDHCKVADYGNGKQRFLSLKYMSVKKS